MGAVLGKSDGDPAQSSVTGDSGVDLLESLSQHE